MPDTPREPKQQTQPKKGKPVEIPVPKRSEIEEVLTRATGPRKKAKKP